MGRPPHALAVVVATVAALLLGGCAECASNTDCDVGDVCLVGTCAPLSGVVVTSSTTVSGATFDVEIAARFEGERAELIVTRDTITSGDSCIAFAPVRLVLDNNGADFDVVTATISGLPSLGSTFRLVFSLKVGGVTPATVVTFNGPAPPADSGGFELRSPAEGDIDVIDTPMVVVEAADVVGDVSVVVVPQTGPRLPLQLLRPVGDVQRRDVLLVRGPQVVVVEATIDGVTRRCSRAINGVAAAGSNRLEFLLVADSQVDPNGGVDVNWLELTSLRTGDFTAAAVCEGDEGNSNCSSSPTPTTPATRTIDTLSMSTAKGFVDVAVVPVIASGPVSAIVRVSYVGAHVGVFGPVTLQPDAGEAWVAGRVSFRDGLVSAAAPSTTSPQPGRPW